MQVTAVHTDVFEEGSNLVNFILRFIPQIEENTVLAVSSKVVALWKNNTVPYESAAQKEALIKQHSQAALKTPLAWLTIKDGMVMTNAGIDESNVNGKLVLLPDGYACAEELCNALKQQWHVQNLGVVITDSMILPLRAGVIAAAVGYSGFKGVKDLRGKPDILHQSPLFPQGGKVNLVSLNRERRGVDKLQLLFSLRDIQENVLPVCGEMNLLKNVLPVCNTGP